MAEKLNSLFLLFMLVSTLLYVVLLFYPRTDAKMLNLSVLISNLLGGLQNPVTLNCAATSCLDSVEVKGRRCTPAGTRTGCSLVTTAADRRSEITTE